PPTPDPPSSPTRRSSDLLRADNGQGDIGGSKVGQLVQLQHVDGDVFALGFGRRASVAGCDKYLLDALILRYFPRQCVLTPATADNQYVHLSFLRRMRSFSQPFGKRSRSSW